MGLWCKGAAAPINTGMHEESRLRRSGSCRLWIRRFQLRVLAAQSKPGAELWQRLEFRFGPIVQVGNVHSRYRVMVIEFGDRWVPAHPYQRVTDRASRALFKLRRLARIEPPMTELFTGRGDRRMTFVVNGAGRSGGSRRFALFLLFLVLGALEFPLVAMAGPGERLAKPINGRPFPRQLARRGLRFAAIGHAYGAVKPLTSMFPAVSLVANVSLINSRDLDFIVLLGDIAYRPWQRQLDNLCRWLDQIEVPVFLAPGNHDMVDRASLQKRFPVPLYGSFRRGGCLFVLLNTDEEGTSLGRMQLNWFNDLIRSSADGGEDRACFVLFSPTSTVRLVASSSSRGRACPGASPI